MEGGELWLATSSDRRVSVWASDWLKDKCELLDWLSFPAPASPEVSTALTSSCPHLGTVQPRPFSTLPVCEQDVRRPNPLQTHVRLSAQSNVFYRCCKGFSFSHPRGEGCL